jgi:MraZ protein
MKLFLGEYDHSLDDRGRVTLPRKLRQELDSTHVVLSRGFDSCIFGFERSQWERESERHLEIPVTDARGREVRRYLFSGAEKSDVDKLGRILLPTHLKEYAQITGSVRIIGAGDHFEIWDSKTWEEYAKRMEG